MAEEYSLADLVKEAITQESSRANADAMRARPTNTMNRVVEEENTIHTQLQELKNEMKVMCIRQSGKYSRKYKPTDISPQTKPCQKCNYSGTLLQCCTFGVVMIETCLYFAYTYLSIIRSEK